MQITFNQLNLNNPLLSALGDLGFEFPTPIQEKAYPIVLSGKDVVAIAQTGTGKTFAYLLPLLRQLAFSEQKHPRILILVPTRELVLQLIKEIERLTTYMTIRIDGVYGGTNINTQKQLVYSGLDILVATPGRLYDLVMTGTLRLKKIQKLVIDEVDEMLALGFRQQIVSIMEMLPEKRQNLMFSATLTPEVEQMIDLYFNEPVKIEIDPTGTPADHIKQVAYPVPNFFTKMNLLEFFLKQKDEFNKVLVFTGNKKFADRLLEKFAITFPGEVGVIHSNKSQNFRLRVIHEFEEGKLRILIATDIAARGIDIELVSHVFNFDTPEMPEDYIHRIGRTGRADQTGISITFFNEVEEPYKRAIETLMKKTIPVIALPEEVEISDVFTEEEITKPFDKTYLKPPPKRNISGAFHQKKEKNMKENSGGAGRKEKKRKQLRRSGKKK